MMNRTLDLEKILKNRQILKNIEKPVDTKWFIYYNRLRRSNKAILHNT